MVIPPQTGRILAGAAACIVIGLLVLVPYYFFPELITGGRESAGISILMGAWVLLVVGIVVAATTGVTGRRRTIGVSAVGIRSIDERMPKQQWWLTWQQLESAEIRVGRVRRDVGWLAGLLTKPSLRVRLLLTAHDEAALSPFAALRQYGGWVYRGVRDEGVVLSRL